MHKPCVFPPSQRGYILLLMLSLRRGKGLLLSNHLVNCWGSTEPLSDPGCQTSTPLQWCRLQLYPLSLSSFCSLWLICCWSPKLQLHSKMYWSSYKAPRFSSLLLISSLWHPLCYLCYQPFVLSNKNVCSTTELVEKTSSLICCYCSVVKLCLRCNKYAVIPITNCCFRELSEVAWSTLQMTYYPVSIQLWRHIWHQWDKWMGWKLLGHLHWPFSFLEDLSLFFPVLPLLSL